ncbi:unnamed protein product [Hymenolepis diminuta]|uniref:Ras-associating domain-containing protein n=1 Tax=Hymenolepis diminuta TaxID=6216 RepID=A0A0R3SD92_HYMDI|nr:unnamed protein product [Hymenolepis diminuta]
MNRKSYKAYLALPESEALTISKLTQLVGTQLAMHENYQYEEFVAHPKVRPISERAVWISVDLPGQGDGEEELPAQ